MEADGRAECARETNTFSKARAVENVLHIDVTVGHIAEMMKSKTKYKFDEP